MVFSPHYPLNLEFSWFPLATIANLSTVAYIQGLSICLHPWFLVPSLLSLPSPSCLSRDHRGHCVRLCFPKITTTFPVPHLLLETSYFPIKMWKKHFPSPSECVGFCSYLEWCGCAMVWFLRLSSKGVTDPTWLSLDTHLWKAWPTSEKAGYLEATLVERPHRGSGTMSCPRASGTPCWGLPGQVCEWESLLRIQLTLSGADTATLLSPPLGADSWAN